MNLSKVAVLLPTCNRLAMLTRTLKSLEAQRSSDFTVYVSDDGSTDGTRHLRPADFPGIQMEVVHHSGPRMSIADHFSTLFYGAKEQIACMAHDDEVYHPDWLLKVVGAFENQEVVLAYGQTVVVDSKTRQVRFFQWDKITPGLFPVTELLRRFYEGQRAIPANGFAVRSSILQKVAPFSMEYEQFDFEWLARVASQGLTRVLDDLLATYTVHSSNTVGSKGYLERFLTQKTGNMMMEEWLPVFGVGKAEAADLTARFRRNQTHLEWSLFLKSFAHDVAMARTFFGRYKVRSEARPSRVRLGNFILLPGISILAKQAIRVAFQIQARRPMRARTNLRLMGTEEALRLFPTLELMLGALPSPFPTGKNPAGKSAAAAAS